MLTAAVTSYRQAPSSIGASVRTTHFGTTIFSNATSFAAVIREVKPGWLNRIRVASPMFVPTMVRVTSRPRCTPLGVVFWSVGGAVCAAAELGPSVTIVISVSAVMIAFGTFFTGHLPPER